MHFRLDSMQENQSPIKIVDPFIYFLIQKYIPLYFKETKNRDILIFFFYFF